MNIEDLQVKSNEAPNDKCIKGLKVSSSNKKILNTSMCYP